MHPLDEATSLARDPREPIRRGRTSDAYWTFIGPFGGASAATALRAVLEHPDRAGDPLAVTVNFCAPIERGEYEVTFAAPGTTGRASTVRWNFVKVWARKPS